MRIEKTPAILFTLALACSATIAGCGLGAQAPNLNVNPSTYQPIKSVPVIIRNVTLMDGLGGEAPTTDVLLKDGKISAIGQTIVAPEGSMEIDGSERYLTPGLIDVHTHYGTASLPYAAADVDNWDVNEASGPTTPEIRIETAFWPQDPAINAAREGGVTTFQVLPGSRNLIGGLGVVMKNVPATTPQAMKFPGAPYGLKMACGENPKAYGADGKPPFSRMGNVAIQRQAWRDAQDYAKKRFNLDRKSDLGKDVLVAALNGDVKIHIHCYRADDMATMIDMSNEFGFKITAFHHAVEAYKISGLLKKADICAAVWSDWWGWKLEAYDGIPENAAFLHEAGVCLVMHSDIPSLGTRLNIEAAKALAAGKRAGLDISKAQALTWITSIPARMLGINDQVGSVVAGNNADVVLWSGDPFSVYAHADQVFIDGALIYDSNDPSYRPKSDFISGQAVLSDRP